MTVEEAIDEATGLLERPEIRERIDRELAALPPFGRVSDLLRLQPVRR